MVEIPEQELERLERIERAARAYVASDPPRPEWRELAHALADADQNVGDHVAGAAPDVHELNAALGRLQWVVPGRHYGDQLIADVRQLLRHFNLNPELPRKHPIAGELHPQPKPCSSFMPDGRSEICARCDWPDEAHDTRGN